MSESDQIEVNKRALYFITHYLPWIGELVMIIVSISLCYYYYTKRWGCEKKEEKDDNKEDPYSYKSLYEYLV